MVDSEEFRKALRAFSTGVAVISVKCGEQFHGMTASSFAAVSVDPQLVLFSVAHTARAYSLLQGAEHFGINLLQSDQAELGHYFAGRRETRLAFDCDWIDDCPILRGTLGYFACRKWAQYPGGDHDIFVGQVMSLGRSDAPPLICSRGIFHRLGPQIVPIGPDQAMKAQHPEMNIGVESCNA